MAQVAVQTAPRWRQIGLLGVKGLLAVVFVAAGSLKLYGMPMMVENFAQIGLGQWFRYLTGGLELVGAVAILIPALAAFGGALLAAIMVGAALTHLFILPGSVVPASVLFALSALVVFAHRDQIAGRN